MPQNVDPVKELTAAVPKFYLSLGASTARDNRSPELRPDRDNAPKIHRYRQERTTRTYYVSYVVVSRGMLLDKGELPASIDLYASANIGGEFGFNGDIIASPAFCGLEHVVMFSRKYSTLRVYDLPSLAVSATKLKTDAF